jgi:hypothetical protein
MDSKAIEKSSFLDMLAQCYRYIVAKILFLISAVCTMIAGILLFLGFVLLIEQVVIWMRVGTWHSPTVFVEVKGILPANVRLWLAQPDDWYGLWNLMQVVASWSAWWVYILLGMALFYVSSTSSRASSGLALRRVRKDSSR